MPKVRPVLLTRGQRGWATSSRNRCRGRRCGVPTGGGREGEDRVEEQEQSPGGRGREVGTSERWREGRSAQAWQSRCEAELRHVGEFGEKDRKRGDGGGGGRFLER
eukprot:751580-Hanusia_phi.AAC.1